MFNYQSLNEQQVLDGVKKYGPAQGAKKIIDWELEHAKESIETGVYITLYNPEQKSECFRLGKNSKCFCDHLLSAHNDKYFDKKFNTSCTKCNCKHFQFVFTRPEQCGMYWLPRRKDFNVHKWRSPCKCKHTHIEHNVNPPNKCNMCQCYGFDSNVACISCDRRLEYHEILYETEQERKLLKKPIGNQYLPLSSNQEIQNEVFDNIEIYQFKYSHMWSNKDQKTNTQMKIIGQQPQLMIKQEQPITNDTVFPMNKYKKQEEYKQDDPFLYDNVTQQQPKTVVKSNLTKKVPVTKQTTQLKNNKDVQAKNSVKQPLTKPQK